MSPFLLNLRLHPDSKDRIMESLSSMVLKNTFKDVMIICSDGSVSLDRLSFGLLFPFLGDVCKGSCSAEIIASFPDYKREDVIEDLRNVVRVSKNHPISEDNNFDIPNVDHNATINTELKAVRKPTFEHVSEINHAETFDTSSEMGDTTEGTKITLGNEFCRKNYDFAIEYTRKERDQERSVSEATIEEIKTTENKDTELCQSSRGNILLASDVPCTKYLKVGMRFPSKEDTCAYIESYCNTNTKLDI